jgi:hypothetical protein
VPPGTGPRCAEAVVKRNSNTITGFNVFIFRYLLLITTSLFLDSARRALGMPGSDGQYKAYCRAKSNAGTPE